MKVGVRAAFQHYLDHMEPIFEALPERLRGKVYPVDDSPHGIKGEPLMMVAGLTDVRRQQGWSRLIYVEHGAGQTYGGDEQTAGLAGYSGHGGTRHHNVIGYICPSPTVAARWIGVPRVAVGCPKMDRWAHRSKPRYPAVCITWHWDHGAPSPESRSAFDHYHRHLGMLGMEWRRQGFATYGHSHPRWAGELDIEMELAGFEVLRRDIDVFEHATILVADNTSLAYEFASLGRPVVSLNAPWYRREVEHGLRFWSHVPGLQVDSPEALLEVQLARLHHPSVEAMRMAAVDEAYGGPADGLAADRAAAFITSLVDSL